MIGDGARAMLARGLEATEGYKTQPDTGTFSYACHAVTVRVDLDVGHIELLDYVVVEDAGTMINPMVVDGQVTGNSSAASSNCCISSSVYR